ncbi:hypothetical protein CYD30_28990, partial [Kosakonia cowanii]
MTDFYAFNDWLWRCEPHLAPRVQSRYDQWLNTLRLHQRRIPTGSVSFTVDGRYLIESVAGNRDGAENLALYCLTECDTSPVAIYQSAGPLFADLIAHSIRRTNHLTAED